MSASRDLNKICDTFDTSTHVVAAILKAEEARFNLPRSYFGNSQFQSLCGLAVTNGQAGPGQKVLDRHGRIKI